MVVEKLALGILYIKNAIENPYSIINDIENLEEKIKKEKYKSKNIHEWFKWDYDHGKEEKTVFCMKKLLPSPEQLDHSEKFYEEQYSISKRLFESLNLALLEYFKEYPYAEKNIKSREKEMHILKYEKSGFLPAHSDHGISSRVLSAVMYLNDDYVGGNIIFQHAGISIKPEAGSVIFFPSNFIYVHEIEKMESGKRYALPNWYHNRKNPYYSDGTE